MVLKHNQVVIRFKGREVPTQEISNMEEIVVGKGQVYLLGDNRNNSMDSRMYGTIPINSIEKEVQYVFWSSEISRIGKLLNE